jgi:hypothetical protein
MVCNQQAATRSTRSFSSGEDERRKSQEASFDRHLVKPIGRAVVEGLVKSAAAKR